MNISLRLSETWFHPARWVGSILFAGFLIAMCSMVVSHIPRVDRERDLSDFINRSEAEPIKATNLKAHDVFVHADSDYDKAEDAYRGALRNSVKARENFNLWRDSHDVTQAPHRDIELIARTRALKAFKDEEEKALNIAQSLHEITLKAQREKNASDDQVFDLKERARISRDADIQKVEWRVFAYRVGLTLPLLAIAGWLFVKKRNSTQWPFVWGFIFFALIAFFVELVPHTPGYSDCVRYIVETVATVLLAPIQR